MPTQVPVTNYSKLNTLKVTQHDAVSDEKTGKPIPNKWKKLGSSFIPPGQTAPIWLESGKRGVFIEEMPS